MFSKVRNLDFDLQKSYFDFSYSKELIFESKSRTIFKNDFK